MSNVKNITGAIRMSAHSEFLSAAKKENKVRRSHNNIKRDSFEKSSAMCEGIVAKKPELTEMFKNIVDEAKKFMNL